MNQINNNNRRIEDLKVRIKRSLVAGLFDQFTNNCDITGFFTPRNVRGLLATKCGLQVLVKSREKDLIALQTSCAARKKTLDDTVATDQAIFDAENAQAKAKADAIMAARMSTVEKLGIVENTRYQEFTSASTAYEQCLSGTAVM